MMKLEKRIEKESQISPDSLWLDAVSYTSDVKEKIRLTFVFKGVGSFRKIECYEMH